MSVVAAAVAPTPLAHETVSSEKLTPGLPAALPVAIVALLFGAVAVGWSFSTNNLLSYGDAQGHLDVARRVLDSRTPSLSQLGTVWLPLPHVLLLLFVYIAPLWQSGLAGSLVGVPCLAVTACALFLTVRQVTGRKAMAWLAALVFLTNPNVLYVHTVALTEPVMFACIAAAMYFLVRWTYTGTGQSLVAAGVACGLGVLSRYENWAFAVIAIVLVTLTAYFLSLDGAHSEGVAIAFAAPAVYAMGLWLFYNWLIFGDPLSFQHNQYSAQAFATVGAAPTKGLLALSFKTFGWAAIDTLGWPALSLALAGLLVYFLRTRLRASSLIPYAFVALFFVGVGLLFLGQTIVITPQSDPPSIYNLRYAMVIMPGVAFFIAYLGSSLARLLPAGAVLIVLGLALASQFSAYVPNWPHGVIAVEEGLRGIGSQPASVEVASFMRINYDGGGILVDESSSIFMTRAGLPLKEYVGTFSGQLFNDALRNPEQAVRWVVFPTDTSRDRIGAVLAPSQQFHSRFRLLKSIDGVEIYQRND